MYAFSNAKSSSCSLYRIIIAEERGASVPLSVTVRIPDKRIAS